MGKQARNLSQAAQAAAMIRKHLRANGINVKVKSDVFSMGSSVDVHVHQDVLPATMREIEAYCDQFQYGHFDGTQDLYEITNHRTDIPQAKYVHVSVHYSDELWEEVRAWLSERGVALDDYRGGDAVWMTLNGSMYRDFWTNRKPRVRVVPGAETPKPAAVHEVETPRPIAMVSPEIADAFGMRGLPNVVVVTQGAQEGHA